MARLGQAEQVEVLGESRGELVSAASRRAAGTDDCCVLDMLPESLLPVPDSSLVDHASQDLNCRNSSEDLLGRHVGIINRHNGNCSWGSSQNVLPDLF